MIFLYEQNEKNFTTAGLCTLPDATSCVVTEERNGAYELEMQYPINGIAYSSITARRIIFCRPNPYEREQPFRIYKISKPINGIVTVYAQHISYDLKGIPLSPFTAENILTALQGFTTYAVGDQPFTFTTDKTTTANFAVTVPSSARSMLGGTDGSLLDVYGGEYVFDRYIVALKAARGENHGVEIRYGKNLTDVTQEENISKVATGVYPYWKSMTDDTLVMLPEKTLAAPGTYTFSHVVPLDLSTEWDEAPTEAQLRARAQKYMEDNAIGVPQVSLSVSFQPLADTVEYKDLAPLEEVRLCDTLTVIYPELGVSATAKVIRCVYNVLLGRYDKIDIGDARTTLADTIAGQGDAISNLPLDDVAKQATESSTNISQELQKLLANGMGLYTSTVDAENGGKIFYMHDKPTLAQSTNIWRIQGGVFAASADGGNTWTAGFTTSGNSVAKVIQTEKIVSPVDDDVYIDMVNGDISAKTLRNSDTESYVQIGSDGTTSQGLFLYRDDVFRAMLSTQPETTSKNGMKTWILSAVDMWLQGAPSQDGKPCRMIFDRDTDDNASVIFEIDGERSLTMTPSRYSFGLSSEEAGSIDSDGYHGWVNTNRLRYGSNAVIGKNEYGDTVHIRENSGDYTSWKSYAGAEIAELDMENGDFSIEGTFKSKGKEYSGYGTGESGYVKLGGMGICWGYEQFTVDISTAWAGIYYAKTQTVFQYPVQFQTAPSFSMQVEDPGGNVIGATIGQTTKDYSQILYTYSPASGTRTFYIHWQAFGLLAG